MIEKLSAWEKDTICARQGKATYTYEVAGVGVYRVDPVFSKAHEWAKPVFDGWAVNLNSNEPDRNGRHWTSVGPKVQSVREGIAACAQHFNSESAQAIKAGMLADFDGSGGQE